MKTLRAFVLGSLSLIASALALPVQGCGWGENVLNIECPPDAGPQWDQYGCNEDAGPDSGQGGAGGSGGSAAFCPGDCVPRAPEGWSEPMPHWVGPADEAPVDCEAVGGTADLRHFGPSADPMKCGTCTCGDPTGTCSPVPEQMTIYSGSGCDLASSSILDFGGPAGWDGSCTTANAVPAGAQCPPGSGIPCAGSVYVSPLPPPVEAPCDPSAVGAEPKPPVKWKIADLGCFRARATDDDIDAVCGEDRFCGDYLPAPYRYCVTHPGEVTCPQGSPYTASRNVVLPDGAVSDDRACDSCKCDIESVGICSSNFYFYSDNACTNGIDSTPISSTMYQCMNLMVPGTAVGSKRVTEVAYLPGKCAASGGEATGGLTIDLSRAMTVCCREEPGG